MARLFFIVFLYILYITSQETYYINKQEEIESVFQNIQAGDEIIFHEWTYQLSIGLNNLKGTEKKPTILKSAEGENIIFYEEHGKKLAISGCNYVLYIESPFAFTNHQIYIINSANYIQINNIKISIKNQNPIIIVGECLNIQLSNSGIFNNKEIIIENSNNINISNNKIYNNYGKGILCLNIETMNFNNNIIYDNSDNNIFLYEFNNVIFDGNYLTLIIL